MPPRNERTPLGPQPLEVVDLLARSIHHRPSLEALTRPLAGATDPAVKEAIQRQARDWV